MLISVIIATYNRVDALRLVLQSLENQTDTNFEILIADDGSGGETKKFIEEFLKKTKNKIRHIWHEDLGFRLSTIRNLATKHAQGDYLIYLDGDCITQPDFIEQHRKLSKTGHMITGSRVLIDQPYTEVLCKKSDFNFERDIRNSACQLFFKKQINKLVQLFIKLPDSKIRNYKKFEWRRIKGCNMACWTSDARAIGGFDESLTGWGHEDADFVFRLQDAGVIRKSGAFATEVFHLWHKMQDRATAEKNAAIVRAKILAKKQV